jgi:pseudaminic acid cytidylyltransferase
MYLAIIPARSGSKRIKNKNIKFFFGSPIIKYSISNAVSSKLFNKVIVSTDSKKIKKISEKYGAIVPFLRSKILSGDFVPVHKVLLDVILFLKKNYYPKFFCLIYSTAVLIEKKDLLKSLRELKKNKRADSICGVCKYEKSIQRALKINKRNFLQFDRPKYRLSRSQDLKDFYYDSGTFVWYKTKNFLSKNGSNLNILPYFLSSDKCQDIDTFDDWNIAKKKFFQIK